MAVGRQGAGTGHLGALGRAGNSAPLPIGLLYNKSSWTDLSDFTPSGVGISVVGGKIRIAGNNSANFSQNIQLKQTGGVFPGATDDENIDFTITAQYVTAVGSGDGINIGLNSINSFVPLSLIADFNAGGSPNLLAYFWGNSATGGTLVTPTQSWVGASISVGDVFTHTLSRRGPQFNFTITNITKGLSNTYPLLCNLADPFNFNLPNAYLFAIYGSSGTFDISNITISSATTNNPLVGCIGDSKTQGFYANSAAQRWVNLLQSQGTISVLAGGGDTTAEALNTLPYWLAKCTPRNWIINIGRNDLGDGVAAGTWQANYSSIVSQCRAKGGKIIHLLPIPETAVDQTALTSYINTTYPADAKIDVSGTWVNGVDLDADGIHPTPHGMTTIYNAIVAAGVITGAAGTPSLLLDTLSASSAVAYSTRKLRAAYSGFALRVQTSAAGNATQDIGFAANGQLDTAALLAFLGANSGTVTIWYDQSGNAHNAVPQSSAPRIVNAGALDTLNSHAAIRWGITATSNLVFTVSLSQPTTIALVTKDNSHVTNGHYTDGLNASPRELIGEIGAAYTMYGGSAAPTGGTTDLLAHSIIGLFVSSLGTLIVDGATVLNNAGPIGTDGMTSQSIGAGDGGTAPIAMDGWLPEYIVFGSALSTPDQGKLRTSWQLQWGTQ